MQRGETQLGPTPGLSLSLFVSLSDKGTSARHASKTVFIGNLGLIFERARGSVLEILLAEHANFRMALDPKPATNRTVFAHILWAPFGGSHPGYTS